MTSLDSAEPQIASPGSYDALAAGLQQLRLEAGGPSYAEIANRITRHREAAGMSPAAARVARSSVYDLFRLGRARVNAELVAETVRTLGCEEGEVAAWRARALAARVEAMRRAPGASTAPIPQPHSHSLLALLTIVLCIAAVALNDVLNFSASALRLPLYLDMAGTAFAAFAFGPWVGAAVGAVTTLLGNLMHGDFTGSWFGLVQITGAVVWGFGFREWFGLRRWRFFLLNVLVAIACSIVAVPIIALAFGGVSTSVGTVALGELLSELGSQALSSLFSVNLLTSLIDKLLAGYLALLILCVLARNGFVPSATVRDRLGTLLWRAKG